MKNIFHRISKAALAIAVLAAPLPAQRISRIVRPISDLVRTTIPLSNHPLPAGAVDTGRAAPDVAMNRMLLVLTSAPEQEAALNRLLADQQDPASPRYRQWLTPEQFGDQFGPAPDELDAMTAWLAGQGFQVNAIAPGHRTIEFSGTVLQVENAFQTEIHTYDVNGETHIANSTDISLPIALAPVSAGVVSLHDFRSRALHHARAADLAALAPDYTISSSGLHFLAPYDFASIYDVGPVWTKLATDGAGQTIAIVARSNIALSDISGFRSLFGLPVNNPQVILNGVNPGVVPGDDLETDLDVEWSGAVARSATIKLIVSASTSSTDGIDLSNLYAVTQNAGGIVSVSYGGCEAGAGSFNTFYNSLWQQAAAQGISVFVSSGDSGSAGCDDPGSPLPASGGLGINGLSSTPFNVAVGGTQFNENGNDSSFWNRTNAPVTQASATGYIPEIPWNESVFISGGNPNNGLWSSGGGVSRVYATPFWQVGPGVPASDPGTTNSHHRYVPDVSLTASAHDGYLVRGEGSLFLISGTSASAPSFAGIMALVNQYNGGGRNGNPNPRLYAMAQSSPVAFHDVSQGGNAVPCLIGSPGCGTQPIAAGIARETGYNAGPGYDLASGLGSVDVYQLVTNWQAAAPSSVIPNPPPGSVISLSGAHIASGGGWETVIELVNSTTAPVQAHVRFYDDAGTALPLPVFASDGSLNTTATGADPLLPANGALTLRSAGLLNAPARTGSALVTADGNIGGFLIFRWTPTGQEVLVPLVSGGAPSYTLAFDNTTGLSTGLALANGSPQAASANIVVRDNTGAVIATDVVNLPPLGHTSFVLATRLPATGRLRGTVEIDVPSGAPISVAGIRSAAAGAFTGIPVLANLTSGGTLGDLASGGDWETLIELVNPSGAPSQAHLRFYSDSGSPLSLPLASTDVSVPPTASGIDPTLASQASAIIHSASAANPLASGSVGLTSDNGIMGFLIFRRVSTSQEVAVPLQTAAARGYVVAFDNSGGLATGLAVANVQSQLANVSVAIRDQAGAQIASSILTLSPQAHTTFDLASLYPATANRFGTIEFDASPGGQIAVVGIRVAPAGALTSIPVLTP